MGFVAVTYAPVHCAICGEPIKLGRKYVAPGLYPYRLAGYGEGDKAHHACVMRACTSATLAAASDLSDLMED